MKKEFIVNIDGEEYELYMLNDELTTKRGDYVGHFDIVAIKAGEKYPIKFTGDNNPIGEV